VFTPLNTMTPSRNVRHARTRTFFDTSHQVFAFDGIERGFYR
jgi:hypothetical protein